MSLLNAHNLYFGTALKIINSIIHELKIEQEVEDCFDGDFVFRSQKRLEEIIPELVRIEKEKCQCQKKKQYV